MCFIRSILTSEFKGICMAFICNLFELFFVSNEQPVEQPASAPLKQSFWGLLCRRLEMVFWCFLVFVVVKLAVWTWTQNDAAQGELGIFDVQTLLLTILGLGQAGNEKSHWYGENCPGLRSYPLDQIELSTSAVLWFHLWICHKCPVFFMSLILIHSCTWLSLLLVLLECWD